MRELNRNVTIVVVILVLVVMAGYLVWLRSRYQPPVSPQVEQVIQTTPTASPVKEASPSASPMKEATGSMKQQTSTPSTTTR